MKIKQQPLLPIEATSPRTYPNYATPTIELWRQWKATDNVVTKNAIKQIIENRALGGVVLDIQAVMILVAIGISELGKEKPIKNKENL